MNIINQVATALVLTKKYRKSSTYCDNFISIFGSINYRKKSSNDKQKKKSQCSSNNGSCSDITVILAIVIIIVIGRFVG
jgi:hypothetical protein